MAGAERAFVVGLCAAILAYCALTILGEVFPMLASQRWRKRLNMGFRVILFLLVAAYLLYNIPAAEF